MKRKVAIALMLQNRDFIIRILIYLFFIQFLTTGGGFAGTEEPGNLKDTAPGVYIDCRECDVDFLRREIGFVNFVRDRNFADIHVLVMSQRTGSGGREYTVEFIGKGCHEGKKDTLIFSSLESDTDDIIRKKLLRTVKLGLVGYSAGCPVGEFLNVEYSPPSEPEEVSDRWNYWVYEIESHVWLNGEQSYRQISFHGDLSARRVTEDLKCYIGIFGNYNEEKFDLGEEEILSFSRGKGMRGSCYFSINDHWSYGLGSHISSSTYSNTDAGFELSPGVEYNIFPYSESARQQLRFIYRLEGRYNDYSQETIYGKKFQYLAGEELSVVLEMIKPWGKITSHLSGSHYFHDFSRNRLTWFNMISLKLLGGFSLNLRGNIARVRDQISLPGGELTEEEILLRKNEVATDYDYWGSISISYTFGSIYNNVVNPRFGN